MCTKGICPHIYLKMYALGIVVGRGAYLDMYPLPSGSSFHANYHWAASSYLTNGNIHSFCFSMGSFISSHTNKCTNMHVLTHNHTFSFCPMFCPHFFRVTTHNTQYNTWNEIHHRMKTRKDKKKRKKLTASSGDIISFHHSEHLPILTQVVVIETSSILGCGNLLWSPVSALDFCTTELQERKSEKKLLDLCNKLNGSAIAAAATEQQQQQQQQQ